jgi:hypothetical protein
MLLPNPCQPSLSRSTFVIQSLAVLLRIQCPCLAAAGLNPAARINHEVLFLEVT